MKKGIFGIIAVVCIGAITMTSLWLAGVFDGNIPDNTQPSQNIVISASERFSISAQQEPELMHSFTDGFFDFWHFYLGRVRYVPVSSSSSLRFVQGQNPVTRTFSRTAITGQTITRSNTVATTRTSQIAQNESSTRTISNSASLNVSAGIERGIFSGGLQLSYTHMRSNATTVGQVTTIGDSVSITSSYVIADMWSMQEGYSFQDVITSDMATGYYRITRFATVDVFIVIAKNTVTGEFLYEFNSFTRENYTIRMEFCPDDEFTRRNMVDMMTFSEDLLDNLETPRINGSHNNLIRNLAAKTDTTIGQISVPYNIKRVFLVGDKRMFEMNVLIEPRNRPIDLILKNMVFTAPRGTHAIAYCLTNTSSQHDFTIMLIGENQVIGGTGHDGQDISVTHSQISISNNQVRFNNLNNQSVIAGTGANAIDIGNRNLTVVGAGNLEVRGGQGGLGGRVSMPSTSAPNNGIGTRFFDNMRMDGGNGGIGIVILGDVSVCFRNATGVISVYGGNGGRGGDGVTYRSRWTMIIQPPPLTPQPPTTTAMNTAIALFHGTNGGAGGDAFSGSPDLFQPQLRPINMIGGQGGQGGSGLSQNVQIPMRALNNVISNTSAATSNAGQSGFNGGRGSYNQVG